MLVLTTLLGACTHWDTTKFPDSDSAVPVVHSGLADSDAPPDSGSGGPTESASDSSSFTIDGVVPGYGVDSGGDLVVISGGPWDTGDVVVEFAGVAATIETADVASLTVRTPPMPDLGEVPLVVRSGAGEATSSFYVFPSGEGLTGAIGAVEHYQYVGNYWSGSPADGAYAWLFLTVPVEFGFPELYAPAMDTCATDWDSAATVVTYALGAGSTAVMSGGDASVTLEWDEPGGFFEAGVVDPEDIDEDTEFGVEVLPAAGSEVPAFSVAAIAQTSTALIPLSPNVSGTSAPSVSQGFGVTWAAGGGDAVLIVMDLYASDGVTPLERVSCVASDDGSFDVPSSAWSAWAADEVIYIQTARYTEATATLPYDHSGTAVAGLYWAYGGAFTR